LTSAGAIALITYCAGSSSHKITSTRVAGVLIDEGFASVDDIADADAASLETVEEFDTTMVEELQERASDAQLVQALGDAESSDVLTSVAGVDEDLAQALIEAEIATVDDLAELSIDELLDIQRLPSIPAFTRISITSSEVFFNAVDND
jgi:N utilization substance protein A